MAPIKSFEKIISENPPTQTDGGMDEWTQWYNEHKDSVVDMGAPVGKTKQVTTSGVSDTKNMVGGYSVVQAESHDAAAKLFENHPHFKFFPDGSIEIMEIMPMP